MGSPADRFTRLQKVAVFLIALGQERTREILADVDLDTVERLNAAIRGLGPVSAAEKASVMLEFAHFFYADEPIPPKGGAGPAPAAPGGQGKAPGGPARVRRRKPLQIEPLAPAAGSTESGTPPTPPAWQLPAAAQPEAGTPPADPTEEERAILNTLEKLRQRLDPGQIDWGRAGYDFGEGFKGPGETRR
ncbi:MAG: hypothetical protein ABIL09_04045 [Gemmatimonadota bacterium]